KMQTVRSGVEVGDSQVQIAEGLKGGERVVSEGQFRLKPGSKVTALKPGETPAAPTEAELKAAEQKNGGGGGRRGGGPRGAAATDPSRAGTPAGAANEVPARISPWAFRRSSSAAPSPPRC